MSVSLILRLQALPLHPLLMVVAKALARAGYGDVRITGRRTPKGKSDDGGHEILCERDLGTVPVRIAVKVVRDAVRVRMLDELAGVVARTGCDLGLVVTPFAPGKTVAAELARTVRPGPRVEVMDGAALARLLVRYGIGVREKGSVDYPFFRELEEASLRILTFAEETK